MDRPKANNYNTLTKMRETLSGKADSVFSYRNVNPYSVMFDSLKRENNENLDSSLWQQAANKGELDQYINLLTQNPKKSSKLAELKDKYGGFVDYDTTMLALSYDAMPDDEPQDRYDANGNLIGKMSQRELIDQVLLNQTKQWDAQILEDAKHSGNFWKKAKAIGTSLIADGTGLLLDLEAGGARAVGDMQDAIVGGLAVISFVADNDSREAGWTFEELAEVYAKNQADGAHDLVLWDKKRLSPEDIAKNLAEQAYDIRRKYAYSVNAETGEYTQWGKIIHGVGDAIGYMSLAMLTGNAAGMYIPMLSANIKENMQMLGPNPDYSKIVLNAGIKTGVEYAIEYGLGKLIGFSQVDNLIGFSDDAARIGQQAVIKGATATGKEAFKRVSLQMAKDMAKEGLEEVLQDASGMFIDYLYGDEYAKRSNESFKLENFTQAFIVGAATSYAIGSVSNLTVHRATGVDEAGFTYKMGMFQSLTYKQAVSTMYQWQQTASDPKAKAEDRINAAMKLQATVATLGNVYETMGMDNAVKAETLLLNVQRYHEKQASIKAEVKAGTYIENITSNLDNSIQGKNWKQALNDVNKATNNLLNDMQRAELQRKEGKSSKTPVAYTSFKKSLIEAFDKLKNSGVTKIETPVDLTAEDLDDNSVFKQAIDLGFDVIVPTDGRDVILSDDVIFIPTDLLNSGDVQAILKEVVTQKSIMKIAENMPAKLSKAILDVYTKAIGTAESHYDEGQLAQQAIAALMFDKNFQLKMLLAANENSNTWGTEQVINFIKHLKKMIAKSYVSSETETTASGKPKRVLSDISKNVAERVIKSLQASIVIMETTIKRSTTGDPDTGLPVVSQQYKEDGILTDDDIKKIEQDRNVQLSTILDQLKSGKMTISAQTNQFVTHLVDDIFTSNDAKGIIKAIMGIDTTNRDTIRAKILKTLSTGTRNEVTDLIGFLTFKLYNSNVLKKSKLVYIAMDSSNEALFVEGVKTTKAVEAALLGGQSIISVIDGSADYTKVSKEITALYPDFDTNAITRFLVLNTFVKQFSQHDFAILMNGTLVKTTADIANLTPELVNAMNNSELFDYFLELRKSKPDGIIRLQDLFSIKLSKHIGNTPLAINWSNGIAGYYHNSDMLHLQLSESRSANSNLTVIFHEMIHEVDNLTKDDYRYNYVGGGNNAIVSQIRKAELAAKMSLDQANTTSLAEIDDYLHINFPIHYNYYNDTFSRFKSLNPTQRYEKRIGFSLYSLLQSEMLARSVSTLHEFSTLGFTYKLDGDVMYLVAPDNNIKWPLTKLPPVSTNSLTDIKARASGVVTSDSEINSLIKDIMQANSIEEVQDLVRDLLALTVEKAANVRMNYDTLVLDTLQEEDTDFTYDIFDIIATKYPDVARPALLLLVRKFKNSETIKNLSTEKNLIGEIENAEDVNSVRVNLTELIRELQNIANSVEAEATKGLLPKDVVLDTVELYRNTIIDPLINFLLVNRIFKSIGTNFVTKPFEAPKSFDFGDYSLTKHTARSYMLTQQLGKGKYISQEVDMETLLPVHSHKAAILDEAMRNRFLFVIAKKIEAAKKAKPEVKQVEKKVESKPAEKATVFQWGQWTVKEFDKTHYVVSKNIDKTGFNSRTDDDYTDENFSQIQVVNKKTLLPDAMLGATGKPILSNTERSNLLDWIEHNTAPEIHKVKDKEDPTKMKYKFVPNLSDKKPKSDEEDFEIISSRFEEIKAKNFPEDELHDFIDEHQTKMTTEIPAVRNIDTWKLTTDIKNELGRLILKSLNLRQLTPLESFRLMGVKDEDFANIVENQSKTGLIHLAGDSIVVPVLQSIYNDLQKQKILTKPIRLIEFFAGYGATRLAMKYNNMNFESWKIAEWAINSIRAYKDMHYSKDTTDYSANLTRLQLIQMLSKIGVSRDYNEPLTEVQLRRLNDTKLRNIYNNVIASNNLINVMSIKATDLDIKQTNKYDYVLTYSFPCQDLSAAGTRKGASDTSTRSGLLWEVDRILKEAAETGRLPKVLLMENVTTIHNKTNNPDFIRWQESLASLGYTNVWADLRADNFGIPQTRVRTFMVSILGDATFEFSKGEPTTSTVGDFLEPTVDKKYYLKTFSWLTNNETFERKKNYNLSKYFNVNKSKSSTLLTAQYKQPGFANLISDKVNDNTNLKALISPTTKDEYSQTKEYLQNLIDEDVVSQPFAYQAPSKNRKYIRNTTAAKSNLKYFIKKGKPIQMHMDVAAFIEGTTDNFDKLSKFFQVRIKNGTLTYHDIINYVATTKSINDYTWQAIANYIYHNEYIAALGPNLTKYFMDPDLLETLALIVRTLPEGDALLNTRPTIVEVKRLIAEFNKKVDSDAKFGEKVLKAKKTLSRFWGYDQTGKLEHYDFIIDAKQLLPIFMRHYDGNLTSFDKIFKIAKTQAGKQILQSLADNTSDSTEDDHKTTKISSGNAAVENNTVGVKSQGSKNWNWLDRLRQNVIDYEQTGYAPNQQQEETLTIDELTDEDKYNIAEEYLYKEATSYTTSKLSAQEEYEAQQEVAEALENMSDAELDELVNYILQSSHDTAQATKAEVIEEKPVLKTIKDQLRNRARSLITKLAGSKVAYNNLDPRVQNLIEFTPTGSRINLTAYTNLSETELNELSALVADEITKIKKAQQQTRQLEKAKATMVAKLANLQKKQAALAEREARVKAREKAVKEGKNLKNRINLTYDTKVAKQTFTITGPSEINKGLQTILDHTWNKTTTSKVKYMDDSVQTIQNVHIAEEFYKAHAEELSTMNLADIEDITDWLINAYINNADSVAKQTFEATRFFILAYIYNETGTIGLFKNMNANLKTELGNYLKSIQTSAGTLLSLVKQVKTKLNPIAIITTELFARFEYKISDIDEADLNAALASGNVVQLTEVLHRIKQDALSNIVPEKVSALRKVAAVRSMSMTSSPMTWLRNIISNTALEHLNPISSKIGDAFLPKLTAKTTNTPHQYKLNGQVTPDIQKYITEQFIESGFFDETLDQLSKYNPSQVIRHKNAGESDIIGDMLVHAIYNHFYSESMFNSKMLNHIHAFLMKRLSDKNWVRRAAIKYLGKILAENNHHLDANGNIKAGIDTDVMKDIAGAFALATTDYMHSDNFFSHVEHYLSQHSPAFWAFYKTIMPFATASWNWFKAAIRYSPVGLGQAIVKLTKLEQEIIARETAWQKGESQIAPEFTSYLIRRDLGSGIIGTISMGFGAILAALGYISLEDDDWGTPKLQIGNLRVDISSIFGSSSVLAGAAFIQTMKTKDLVSSLDAMLDPLADGFFFTDLLQMDANSPKGWFEWTKYQVESVGLSFIPSMVRYVSGMTYTGTYRTNNVFQKAVVRLPFLGQAFNVPKKTDIYTGDSDGTFWDIVHRLIPYFEIVTKSQAQRTTEMYGLNKEELNGTYKINGASFKTEPAETARINKLYGELNSNDLTNFYANKTAYKVLTDGNKYATKYYSQMTQKEITNALDQIFSANSTVAKISAWLAADHAYYTNDQDLFKTLRSLGYTKVFLGNKGFVD